MGCSWTLSSHELAKSFLQAGVGVAARVGVNAPSFPDTPHNPPVDQLYRSTFFGGDVVLL